MRKVRIATLILTLVFGLLLVGPAAADDPSVIDQYQEPFPTGGGNDHTGGNGGQDGGGGGGSQLPESLHSDLDAAVPAPVADSLEVVATSPDLGAPQTTLGNKAPASDSGEAVGSGSPLTDAVSAATDSDSLYLPILLLALGAVTIGGGAFAVARRRQSD
jgi:hypothetical protein